MFLQDFVHHKMSYKADATPNRLLVLDVMRGIALFGILYVNLFGFGVKEGDDLGLFRDWWYYNT